MSQSMEEHIDETIGNSSYCKGGKIPQKWNMYRNP